MDCGSSSRRRIFSSYHFLIKFSMRGANFGLAQQAEEQLFVYSCGGYIQYVALRYVMTKHFLVKSDVYSYRVVLLEVLTGKMVNLFDKPDTLLKLR
ncbi:unnamed protein product [Lactuca virosa]|uniref:Protein kinase domain-containing protein n=1 Tax=Lactuca virosa TaxID=75947 RepID=A0AAU9PKR8_9ASTR|nr:unnamed protein product [Lactuca virosa]